MKKFLFFCFFIQIPLFFSCSQADEFEERIVKIDKTENDTIINEKKDTIINKDNDTIIIIKKDTLISGSIVKDTIKLSYKRYMGITPSYGTGQGAACYGKYFFQGYSGNAALGIYDLEKKYALSKLDIPAPASNNRIHANTINFGNERVSPDDYFPLLYVSSGYTQNVNGAACSFLYVYRISKYDNSDGTEGFHIEFVQTITLKGFGSWTEGIIDNDHNILWIKYEPNGTSGEYRYASFPMPKLENGDVTVLRENAITDFSLGVQPFTSSNQGHLYHDNKILLVSGTSPTTQKIAFIVINPLTQSRELVIDLTEIGLTSEPENVFYYGNQLMIGYRGAIFKFNLYPNSLLSTKIR